ncbi:MAG: glycosyltransferase family 4 protein [Deltaproteobacteria bacterium]|nr:glycosyltransferase family 4 protein [Deltaproteobacteria bacterium]
MKIGFYAGNSIPIHGGSLEERPLGGTETALIRLAEELYGRGHDVSVLTAMKDPPPSEVPYFFHGKLLELGTYDLLVIVQFWRAAYYGASFKKLFFWTGDGPDQYANFGIGDKRLAAKLDALLAVSKWQAESLAQSSGFPIEKIKVIGNGAHLPYFKGDVAREPKRLIYASAAYRGLQYMPPIFERIRHKHPEAELHIFAGMKIYDREQPFQGPEAAQEKAILSQLENRPGVVIHENVTQKELATEMMKSAVLVYPNIVHETCCIVALEAQAAGCPVVASNNSALPETVGENGILIDGDPSSSAYQERFIAAVDGLLSDAVKLKTLSESCLQRAKSELGWEKVADRFEALLGRQ